MPAGRTLELSRRETAPLGRRFEADTHLETSPLTVRSRLLAAAALLLAAGAAQAQPPTTTTSTTTTSRSQATQPAGARAGSPMSTTSPQSPTSPVGAPAVDATPPAAPADAGAATPPSGSAFTTITPAPGADVVTVLTQSGQFSTFLKAADATALTSVLKSTPNLTVFAPTDAAFAALPAGTLDNLMKPDNLPQLQKLLAYHLVNTKIPAIKGHARTQVTTAAAPAKVTLDGSGEQVKVNDATTLQPAVAVGNGATLYPIDKVLSPDYVPPPAPAATEEAAPAADANAATTTKKTTTTRRKR